ncbi:unnamed protein product [Rhodiola kirilowii]
MLVNAKVKSTLENGVMLSFLTHFTGTLLIGKITTLLTRGLMLAFCLLIQHTRAVGLTLNPHLVHNMAPQVNVKTGDIYDASKVVRCDKGLGLLLEIPSAPASVQAYVGIHDLADEEVKKMEKKFKEGSRVRARILGFRHLGWSCYGHLKGMLVKGKVIVVDSFGALVQISDGVKALCPLPHMSEFDVAKPGKKFKGHQRNAFLTILELI